MILDLIANYNEFSDSCIKNVQYNLEKDTIYIKILVININFEYKWDLIEIKLKNIIQFRLIESKKIPNSVVLNALLCMVENNYAIDFNPIDNGEKIVLNEQSNFIIICKEISYQILTIENEN